MKFLALKAVLNDAEAKQITNSDVKDWVDELKDVMYDAEDLVDEITTEALRCKMESDSQTTATQVRTSSLPRLIRLVRGSSPGGDNKEEIVNFLLSHNASGNGIGVIALVGMGGIGKTTLTQLVYNDRRVDRYFDLRAWVCVSDEFDLVRITKTIVKAIDSGTSENSSDENDLNLLQLKLKERLSRKKFCLVLDDVWNENYNNWDRLQTPFTVGLPGIILEDCWSLFAKQAFKNGDSSRHPKLEEIGKEIVKKCKGLPLAAKTLGGALYSESRVEEWENVLNSETWDLPNDEILPALRLRHLDIRHSKVKEMPSQLGQLKSLQKLTNYRVGKESGPRVGELRELSHIGGILRIKELQNVVDGRDASEANLVGKQYLNDLRLEWNDDDGVDQNGADIVLHNLLPHSNLKRLTIQGYGGLRFPDWLGGPAMLMINMVSLRLWRCKNVSAFPPLGQLPSLKHLYISGAEEVERVGAEFYGTDSSSTKPSFVSLKALSFSFMPKWKEWLCLGSQGGEFPRLKELYIQDCPKLTGDLPDHLPLLTKLNIEECEQLVAPLPRVPAIRELTTRNSSGVFFRSPASDFMRLESLITSDISKWTELPPVLQKLSIENADCLESLLEEEILQSNTCLQDLTFTKCSFSRTLCRVCLPITLKSLRIYESKNLELLLPEFFKCHFSLLERLNIYYSTCNSLSCFPLSIFPRLTFLQIYEVRGLESLSFSISEGDPTSFDILFISGCPNLVSIELPALNFSGFSIYNCKNLKSLLHNAACFQSLTLNGCPELIFPVQGLPSNLTSLSITNCEKFRSQMELGLQGLTSLRRFSISSKCEDLELFPKECLLPSTLTSLEISDLPNLRSLDSKGLQLLTTLQKLKISYCPKLQSLTEEGLPTSLSFLTIENCPLLKDRCKFGTGEEWHHIAHIPHILIDNQLLLCTCFLKLVHQAALCSQEEDLPLPAHAIDGSLVAISVSMGCLSASPFFILEHTPAVKDTAWSPHQSGLLAFGGGTADQYICFWSTTSGNQLSHVDIGSEKNLEKVKTAFADNSECSRDETLQFRKHQHQSKILLFDHWDEGIFDGTYGQRSGIGTASTCSLVLSLLSLGLDDNFHLAVKKVDGRGQDSEKEFEPNVFCNPHFISYLIWWPCWPIPPAGQYLLKMLVLDSAESLIFQVKSPAETLLIMPWRHMVEQQHRETIRRYPQDYPSDVPI
ncbi:putative disease resistance RPP13-like protein 1 [Vitis vinifera]|uniref:Putative disease resistance RPP13-like protein 1 n=1 Tax=Vitis vinifera TaxID=29760 RepID=A0A438D548_VITVI|nr:putative disease resistance RPP13-like protein 1 [Vitis vinifera]